MSLIHDVTDRVRAQEAMKQSEERLRAIVENAWDGVIIFDEEYNVLFESPSIFRLTGYSPEEWRGKSPAEWPVHPEDLPSILASLDDLRNRKGATISGVRMRLQNKDGSWRMLEATGHNLLHDPKVRGIVANFRDITEHVRSEEALRASEERFRTLIEKATDVVIVLDATGKITYQSPSLERVTGFGPNEWVDRSLNELLIHPDDMPRLASLLQRILTQPGATIEGITVRYQHKDRSWHILEATVTNMLHDPKVNGIVANFRDITDRKMAEEALAESEQKYRLLVENSNDVVFSLDTQGNFTYVSPSIERISGYHVGEIVGTSFTRFVLPEDMPGLLVSFEKTLGGAYEPAEFRALRKDGAVRYVRTASQLVRSADGQVVGLTGIMSDITERRKTEEALQRSEALLRDTQQLAGVGGWEYDVDKKTVVWTDETYRIHEIPRIPTIDHVAESLKCYPPEERQIVTRAFQKCCEEGVPYDLELPFVTFGGKQRWVRTTARAVREGERIVRVLGTIADITERKRAEEALRASEERNRLLVENASEVIAVIQDGLLKFVNSKITDFSGYSPEELVSRSFAELIYPEDRQMVADNYSRRMRGEQVPNRYQFRILHKNGDARWAEISVALFAWDGRPALLALLSDISARKQAEQALREAKEYAENIIRTANAIIVMLDVEGRVTLLNEAGEKITGYRQDELLGKNWFDVVVPRERYPNVWEQFNKLKPTGKTVDTFENPILTKSGEERIIAWRNSTLTANDKVIGTLSFGTDITDRKKAEEALRRSEGRFRQITENMLDAVSLVDANGIMQYVSPSHERILGYRPEDLVGKSVFDFVPPEDVEGLIASLDGIHEKGEITYQYRFRHADGHYLWGEASARVIRDDNGNVTGYVIAGKDITDRKKAEEALKESEAKYKRLFETTQTAMEVISMETGLVVLANEATARMFGFASPEEVVGQDPMKYLRPEDVGWVSAKMAQAVADESWEEVAELQVRTNDGRRIWVSGTVRPTEYQGKPALLVSLLDITSRKRIEETLRESEEKYRLLTEKTNDIIYTTDLNLNNTYVSPSVERILGFKPEEYLERSPDQRMTLDSLARAQEALLEHLSLEKDPNADPNRTVRIELEFYRKDGSTVWLEHQVSGIRDANGTAIGLHGVARDITERKRAEQALKDSEAIYKRLFETAQTAMEVISGETGLIVMANEAAARMFGFASPDELIGVDPMQYLPTEYRDTVATQMAQALMDKSWRQSTELPVSTRDGRWLWIGAMVTPTEYRGKPALLASLMDLTAKKEAQETLRTSEEKYRLLAEKTNDIIFTLDLNLRTTYVSPSVERILGFTPAERLAQEASQQMTPESYARATKALAEHLALEDDPTADPNRSLRIELEFYRKDGSTVWLENQVSGIRDSTGRLVGLHAVARDVSERRKAEQALKESEAKYRLVAESTNDEIWTSDMNLNTTYVSPSVERLLGFTVEERMKQDVMSQMTPESFARAMDALAYHLKLEEDPAADPHRVLRIELEYYRKDGSTVWLENQVSGIRDASGKLIGFHGVARDVTERRRAEQALRASEEKYRRVFEGTQVAMEIISGETGLVVMANEAIAKMFGFASPEDMIGRDSMEYLAPEDRQWAAEGMARVLQDPSMRVPGELRARTQDGRWIWISAMAVQTEYEGKPALLVSILDVTERKQAEETLRASEEKYRLLTERTDDIVWTTDLNLRTTYMSPSVEKVLGFKPEERIGLETAAQITPGSLARAQQLLAEQLELEKQGAADPTRTVKIDLEYYRKDGSTVWLEALVGGIRDESGNLIALHGVSRDISERRRAEESLRERLKELQCIASISRLAEKPELPIEEFLQETVGLLPPAWQHPEVCAARITVDSKEFKTPNYHDTAWMQSADITVDAKRFGTVTVCYLKQMPEADEGPFLKEERDLIDTIADFLGHVIQHRQMEHSLRASEERYRLLAQNASDIIWLIDSNLKITYVSPSATALLGYSAEELMASSFEGVLTAESLSRVAQIYMDDMATEKAMPGSVGQRLLEIEAVSKSGSHVWLEVVTRPIRDPSGQIAGFQGACRDVTQRRQVQEALAASEMKYRDLFDQTLLGMEVVDGQTGRVVLANHAIARMFGFDSPEEMIGLDAITGWVMPEDTEWVVREFTRVMSDPQRRDVATLRVRGKDGRIVWVAGSGTFFDYEGKPAVLISLIDVTAAKEAESKLRESEEKNRLLIETAAEAIAVIQDGIAKFFNRRLVELTGWTATELLTKSFLDLVHPDDRERVALNYMNRVAGEDAPNNYTFRIVDKNGRTKWLQVSAVRFDWEGQPATLDLFSDVTERVVAEQALKDSEERFRSLVEKATDAVAVIDAAGTIKYYTPSMERVTGYRPGEWIDKSLSDLLLHPDDLPKLTSILERVLKEPGASVENFTTRYRHRDGTWHVLEATARNMLHDPKIGGIVANFRDITERVKAEERLKESEERYRLLAENAADIIWVVDLNLNITYVSPAVTRLLDYTVAEVTAPLFINKLLTPDSLETMARLFTDDLVAEQSRQGSLPARTVEIEVVSKSGSKFWLEAAINPIRDAEGRLIGFQGAGRDITDRKKAEESLRRSEERFRGLVETTSDWVWETDHNNRYTYVSPRVRDVLGYEPEELLGRTPFEFMHQRESRRVSKIIRRFATAKLPFSLLENTCVHKDGHSVVMETSAVPIIDSDGTFRGYRGIDRDITERKRVEQELQRSLKRLEKTMESTIEAITTTIETRDPYTTGHQMRVTDLACAIAKVMELPPSQIEGIRVAGLLHDIGKIAIPTEILSKPGKLNEVEYEMIKTHSKVGYNILKKIEFPWPVARTVLQHHERWNGSGYPHGIRGEDILLEARILAVADVMEAMSSHRPYRPSIGVEKALDEIATNKGILYDPAVADACIAAFTEQGFKFSPSLPGGVPEATSISQLVDHPEDA
ncbi:MAG: PAS domain S-box protein [Dehalococcoidia bacterium]|nr:PAS domain S-box protein [Dehalococcoidia bacterium]